MKTAYDRGYEMGTQALKGEGPMTPYHYSAQERADWLEGWCKGYLAQHHGVLL